jgi:hypothetical protein
MVNGAVEAELVTSIFGPLVAVSSYGQKSVPRNVYRHIYIATFTMKAQRVQESRAERRE